MFEGSFASSRVHDVLYGTALCLRRAGKEAPELEARRLLGHVLGLSHSGLILAARQEVTREQLSQLLSLLRQRMHHVPLEYLFGSCEFWSLDFLVSPAVLIPRPETEFLLECVLAEQRMLPESGCVLDLCCGSGVIAVVLARELISKRRIFGGDLSFAALELARKNARRFGVAESIDWLCADLCDAFASSLRCALVVANPPYIASGEIAALAPEVRDHEPRIALDGGDDGLAVIRRLLRQAGEILVPEGVFFCEIGADQEMALMAAEGPLVSMMDFFVEFSVIKDWAGRPRVLRARRRPEGR